MTGTPTSTRLHDCEPTDEQLQRAKRIASKTGQTVEQVLAAAVKRGASDLLTRAITGQGRFNSKPH